jgi:hypothetical protein
MNGFIELAWAKITGVASVTFLLFMVLATTSLAEECKTASEMDAATKSALEGAAQRYFQAAATGNAFELQQNAIPSVASDFGGIQSAITENKANLGTSSTVRASYELDAPGNAPVARAEFYCGIMNSSNYVAFAIPNLPPGNYGVVMLDPQGGKNPVTVTFILQQSGAQWKIHNGMCHRRSNTKRKVRRITPGFTT